MKTSPAPRPQRTNDRNITGILTKGLIGVSICVIGISFIPERDKVPRSSSVLTSPSSSTKGKPIGGGSGGGTGTKTRKSKRIGTKFFFDTTAMALYCCHHGSEGVCAPICIKGLPGYNFFEIWKIANSSEVEELEEGMPPLPLFYDGDEFKSRCAGLPNLQYYPRLDAMPIPSDTIQHDACLSGGWLQTKDLIAKEAAASSSFSWLFDRYLPQNSQSSVAATAIQSAGAEGVAHAIGGAFCFSQSGRLQSAAGSKIFQGVSALAKVSPSALSDSQKDAAAAHGPALVIPIGGAEVAFSRSSDVNIQNQKFAVAADLLKQNPSVRSLVLLTSVGTKADVLRLAMLDVKGLLHTELGFAAHYQLLNIPYTVVNCPAVGAPDTFNAALRETFVMAKKIRYERAAMHKAALDAYVPDLEPWKPPAQPRIPSAEEAQADTTFAELVAISDSELVFLAKAEVFLSRLFDKLLSNEGDPSHGSAGQSVCYSGGILVSEDLEAKRSEASMTTTLQLSESQMVAARASSTTCYASNTEPHALLTDKAIDQQLAVAYDRAQKKLSATTDTTAIKEIQRGFDAILMEALEQHKIRFFVPLQVGGHVNKDGANGRSAGAANNTLKLPLLNEHFMHVSKEVSRYCDFTFNIGVMKERGKQVQRYMKTDVLFGQQSSEFEVAAMYMPKTTAQLEITSPAADTASEGTSSPHRLRVPSSSLALPFLTLDETRRAISLSVCAWLRNIAVVSQKPHLVPFWCSTDNEAAYSNNPSAEKSTSFFGSLFGSKKSQVPVPRQLHFGFVAPRCPALADPINGQSSDLATCASLITSTKSGNGDEQFRTKAFASLRGILESLLIMPSDEATALADFAVNGGSKGKRGMCGVDPMASSTEPHSCLRKIIAYVLSPASRPHTPYQITATQEEKQVKDSLRSGQQVPDLHPPLLVPEMAQAVIAFAERLSIPPIRDVATRNLMVSWVMEAFEKDAMQLR